MGISGLAGDPFIIPQPLALAGVPTAANASRIERAKPMINRGSVQVEIGVCTRASPCGSIDSCLLEPTVHGGIPSLFRTASRLVTVEQPILLTMPCRQTNLHDISLSQANGIGPLSEPIGLDPSEYLLFSELLRSLPCPHCYLLAEGHSFVCPLHLAYWFLGGVDRAPERNRHQRGGSLDKDHCSTRTPRQKATWSLIRSAADFGSG